MDEESEKHEHEKKSEKIMEASTQEEISKTCVMSMGLYIRPLLHTLQNIMSLPRDIIEHYKRELFLLGTTKVVLELRKWLNSIFP